MYSKCNDCRINVYCITGNFINGYYYILSSNKGIFV